MAEIKINLLPKEFYEPKKGQGRKLLIFNLSILVLVIMVFLTAAVFITGFLSSNNIKNLEEELDEQKTQTQSLKDKEALLFVLKERLTLVTAINKSESPQSKAFNLITSLLPSQVVMLTFSSDKNGQVVVSGETASNKALQQFFNNLTDPAINEGSIQKVQLSSLNLSSLGVIRFDVTFNLK